MVFPVEAESALAIAGIAIKKDNIGLLEKEMAEVKKIIWDGTTINSYLIAKRITRAKQMLRFTDKTLEEIAVSVGMNGGNYFSRMFKKIEGISPREYRKQW